MIVYKQSLKSDISVLQKPKSGQNLCGDAFFVKETDDYLMIAIVDGLGSGKEAHQVADNSIKYLEENHSNSLENILRGCNQLLQGSRGAVMGVMKLAFASSTVSFAGIGNIQCILFSEEQRLSRALSSPGYLNGRPIQYRVTQLPYKKDTFFMMFSDGLVLEQPLIQNIRQYSSPQQCLNELEQNVLRMSENDDLTVILGKCSDL